MKQTMILLLVSMVLTLLSGCQNTQEIEREVVDIPQSQLDQSSEADVKELTADLTQSAEASSQPTPEAPATDAEMPGDSFQADILLEGMEETVEYTRYESETFSIYYDRTRFKQGTDWNLPEEFSWYAEEFLHDQVKVLETVSFAPESQEKTTYMNISVLDMSQKDREIIMNDSDKLKESFQELGHVASEKISNSSPEILLGSVGEQDGIRYCFYTTDLSTDFNRVYLVYMRYPVEMEEGYGARFRDMLQYFNISSEDPPQTAEKVSSISE